MEAVIDTKGPDQNTPRIKQDPDRVALDKLIVGKNTGILPDQVRDTDYVAGVNSPLPFSDVLDTGDWSPFAPSNEWQLSKYLETFNCTGFSLTNIIEFLLNFMIARKMLPPSHLDFLKINGYFDDYGKVDLSERALGTMAGTGDNIKKGLLGNYFTTVIDTARKMGLAPNRAWSWDQGKELTTDAYYAPVSDNVKALALRFNDYFQINYERLNDQSLAPAALKQCPLWVGVHVCPGWNSPPVPFCGAVDVGHAVDWISANGLPMILDSYGPYFFKQLAANYQIPVIFKVLFTLKNVKGVRMEILKVTGEQTLVVRNGQGKFFEIATTPDLYPTVAQILGIDPNVQLNEVPRDAVNAALVGQVKPVLSFIEK